jgi:ankyrin repeat protein
MIRFLTLVAICVLAATLAAADEDRDRLMKEIELYYGGELSLRTIPLALNPRQPNHLPVFLDAGIPADATIEWTLGEKTYTGSLLVYTLRFSCDDEETADVVQILLDGGAEPNDRDPVTNDTPLMRVAACPRVVKMLLDAGADPNATADRGTTALRRAVGPFGSAESARALIDGGADVHGDREKLEDIARRTEDPEKQQVIRDALARPAPRKLEPFEFVLAIGERNLTVVHEYLKQNPSAGAAPEGEEPRLISLANRCTDDEQIEPVLEVLNVLLEAGANVNGVDSSLGNTPLHVAARACQAEVVKALVDAGAAVEAKDSADHTPLFNAVLAGRAGAVEVLVDAGAKADRQTKFFANNKPEIKKLLKKKR